MTRKEAKYNRQSALLACQEILKREEKNNINISFLFSKSRINFVR